MNRNKFFEDDIYSAKDIARRNSVGSSNLLKINNKFKLSKNAKRGLLAGLVISLIATARACSDDEKKSVYLVDVTDKYQNEATLFDSEDMEHELDITTEDPSKLVAIVDSEKTKKGKAYHAIIVNEDGKMTSGYIDGKYLDNKAIDKVEVTSDVLAECNIVGSNSGLWLREETVIDHATDAAVYLENGTYIASTKDDKASKDNSYMWKESIHYNGEGLDHGYVVSDYIINSDFEIAQGKRFTVNLENAPVLKLRSSASTDSEVIEELVDGQEVVLIPNVSSVSDGEYDWFFVAVNTPEGIKTGYAAATMYGDNKTVRYLVEKDNRILKKVDTSNDECIGLKLRSAASTDARIVEEIPHGQTVVVLSHVHAPINDGEREWVFIATESPEGAVAGYVASDYLVDIEKKDKAVKEEQEETSIDHSNGKKVMKVVDTSSASYADLKLREAPGTDSEIISKIEDGTEIYTFTNLISEGNEAEEVDGHKWTKVYLLNGKSGYVASDYLKDKDVKDINELLENEVTIDFYGEGKQDGYFGIDVKNTVGYTDFERLISNDHNYDVSYAVSRDEVSQMSKPNFVMFRLGATGYGGDTATMVSSNEGYLDNLVELTNVCDKYQIPYGFYYYSQAINKEEVDMEAKFINKALDRIGDSEYNVLPLVIDVEAMADNPPIPTRACNSAKKNGKSHQTGICNMLMNRVRDDNDRDVILYTDNNSLDSCIEFDLLDKANQQNVWLTDPNETHSNKLVNRHIDAIENAGIRQIALDGVVDGVGIDVDFIDSDYFKGILKKNKLISKNDTGVVYTKKNNG